MLLKFIITITSLVTVLFLILWYRTFKSLKFWKYIPALWRKSKTETKINEQHEKAIAEGKKPFHFENGAVVIYAKTQSRAIYDYNQIKLERKRKLKVVK